MPLGGVGQAGDRHLVRREIVQLAVRFDEEMVVVAGVGVEIGAAGRHHDLTQQAGVAELVQRVVDVASETGMRVALTSACRPSAVTWRWPPSNSRRAKATRWRVGRRPAARRRAGEIRTGAGHVLSPYVRICRQGLKRPRCARFGRFALGGAPPYSAAESCFGGPRCGTVSVSEQKHSYTFEDLIECAKGRLFGPGNAQLPLPPMLMFDRIAKIDDKGGRYGKGEVVAEFDVKPDLWFFACHFKGDPVMPGCLGARRAVAAPRLLPGLDEGARPRPRAGRGRGEVHRHGAADRAKLTYHVTSSG